MRILHVITDTDRRGAQLFAVDLDAALRSRHHGSITVALAPGTDATRLDVPVLGRRRRGLGSLRSLRRRAREVDVVVAHGSATASACAMALRRSRPPWVYRQVSDTRFWAASRSRRWRVRAYLRRAARIVALSGRARTDLVEHLGLAPGKITVVPNAVDPSRFPPATTTSRRQARAGLGLAEAGGVIITVAALVPEKGVDLVVQAAGHLAGATLLVVGNGPERAALEALGERVAPGRVRFLGVVDDLAPVYAAADVVVLASRGGDSLPAVLIEAAFVSTPSVATAVGAIEDAVVDGVTGFVVPVEDLEALVEAVGRLLVDPGTRAALGAAASAHCRARFGIDDVASAWESALSGVAAPG